MQNHLFSKLSGVKGAGFLGLLALAGTAQAVPLTPGNLVVVRVGTGAAALSSAATAVFLDEYTTAGVFVQTLAMPTAISGANQPLTNSGSATSEGFLNLSSNGQYLVNFGYAAVPGTAAVGGTTSAAVNRVVGRTDLFGNTDTTTALTDAHSGQSPRGVTSDNGTQFWTSGNGSATSGGLRYCTFGATTSLQLSTTVTNLRCVGITPTSDLWITSASGTFLGVSTVTGLPTTSGQTINYLPGFPTVSGPSSYDVYFLSSNTIYVADDRTNGNGGIQRWDCNMSTSQYVLSYTLALNATTGCRGLTGINSGTGVVLYATTSQTSVNQIVTVTDTGAGSLVTALTTPAVAATNTGFRGIRLLPAAVGTPSTAFCSGDGTDTPCPCNNPGLPGRGCENTAATGGADIATSGLASISADTLVITSTNAVPFGPGLYYEGNATANAVAPFGVQFGNGLRCAGGTTNRLEVRFADGVGMSNTTVSLSAFGAAVASTTYYYQLWYRDSPNFGACTGGFNFSNARSLTWIP